MSQSPYSPLAQELARRSPLEQALADSPSEWDQPGFLALCALAHQTFCPDQVFSMLMEGSFDRRQYILCEYIQNGIKDQTPEQRGEWAQKSDYFLAQVLCNHEPTLNTYLESMAKNPLHGMTVENFRELQKLVKVLQLDETTGGLSKAMKKCFEN